MGTGLVLGVRAAGDWTKALNGFACNQGQGIRENLNKQCKYLLLRPQGCGR